MLTGVRQVRFAGRYDQDGAAAAIGRGVVADEAPSWLGLWLIEVRADRRRQGLALELIGALARWAAEVGADRAYLQVDERNAAAIALYDRLGFTTHHTYTVWVDPA